MDQVCNKLVIARMDSSSNVGVLEEFRLEFWRVWERLPNKGLFLVLLGAWLLLFQVLGNSTLGYIDTHSLLQWMYSAYTAGGRDVVASDDAFALLIPIIVLALMWSKREELLAQDLRTWWPGLILVAMGLVIHLLGFLVQQPRISIVGLFTGIYGLMGLAWGPGWLRASFFPFFLFAFCVPLGSLAEPITFRLRLLVTRLVEIICHYFLAIDVVREGTMLTEPAGRYHYEVAAACSGIRSLVATVALAIILAFVSMRAWWRRGLMIAAAFPLAVLGNLLRMLSIVVAAEFGSQAWLAPYTAKFFNIPLEVALQAGGQKWGEYIHDGGPMGIFSLLPYIAAFIGLLMLERYLDDRPRPLSKPKSSGPVPPGREALAR